MDALHFKSLANGGLWLQTKETLTLKAGSFGSKCELADKFLKKLGSECGVVDLVASFADFKNSRELKKSDGAKRTRIIGGPHFPQLHPCPIHPNA